MADETGPILRGTFEFEVTENGDLVNSSMNVESLRRMWMHPTLVEDEDLGPGNRGDFDIGAWHVACHLAGAGGVMRSADGRLFWLEISHDPARDDYFASATTKIDGVARTHRIDSAEGRLALRDARLLGFVEGNSLGRVSARFANDPPTLFNL